MEVLGHEDFNPKTYNNCVRTQALKIAVYYRQSKLLYVRFVKE